MGRKDHQSGTILGSAYIVCMTEGVSCEHWVGRHSWCHRLHGLTGGYRRFGSRLLATFKRLSNIVGKDGKRYMGVKGYRLNGAVSFLRGFPEQRARGVDGWERPEAYTSRNAV